MREPQTYCDKSLLEDEPFLSTFKARQLGAPPTRRGTTGFAGDVREDDSDDARNNAIAQIIIDMKLFKPVKTWLSLAFTPHYQRDGWREVDVTEPGMICLFVKFYWALFQGRDSREAILILQAARKKQGCGYYVNNSVLKLQGESTADLTKQVHPKQTSQTGDDTFPSQSKNVPGSNIKLQKILNAKKDVPGCPERDSSQTCPTPLSVSRQIESNPPTLPSPPDSQNTMAIRNLPKKRKMQMNSDKRRVKHQKIKKAASDTILCNVSRNRNDDIDEKTEARPSQREIINDKADHVSNDALSGPSLSIKMTKDVPGHPEREGESSSQTCQPSLYPTSLSVSREIGYNSSTLSLPPDSQNTSDLPKQRKRQTSPDTPHKKHRGINGATLDASTLGDNNNEPQPQTWSHSERKGDTLSLSCPPVASSTSDSTRNELDETDLTLPSNAPVHKIHDPQRGVEAQTAQGKEKIRPIILPPSNPKKRRASSSKGHQRKQQEVPVDQGRPTKVKEVEGSASLVPISDQPYSAIKKRGRPPKVKEGQEGSTSKTVQPALSKEKGRHFTLQAQLNDRRVVFGQNFDITQETSITPCIPFSPAQTSHAAFGFQETIEGLSRYDQDRDMKEEIINHSKNWLMQPEDHDLVEENGTLDFEAPAATDIYPTQKPPLSVNPPIWAQSRQEVCETFDWFRSYQGGVYFAHNAVKGYLLSAFSSKRDRFEHGGKLIISHGGGKSESIHTRKGQVTVQPATDQLAQDKSVRALMNNYRNQRPLALLIDDKYALFPYDLGVKDMTYVVLGFYTIAHAWAEYQPTTNGTGHVVRYKFAFRWCDDQGSPWWLTDKETNLSDSLSPSSTTTSFSFKPTSKSKPRKLLNDRDTIPEKQSEDCEGTVLHTTMVREAVSHEAHEAKSFVCRLCHMDSLHVYTWAWLCLHPDCCGFWKDIMGNYPPDNLEYNLDFLKLMTSTPVPRDFGKLKPDPPPRLSEDGTITSYAFTRGFHCNSCGRLSCRFKWEKWECSNCKEFLPVFRTPHTAKDFWSNLLPVGYKDHFINKKSRIEKQPARSFKHDCGMGSIQSFILPDGRGMIHHIQPGSPLGRLEADKIFIEYQQQATAGELKFRRWPLRSHKCRGPLLTNYFSQNSGEPYQYVGGAANTVPFENAPGAVVKARALIQKRIWEALGTHVQFNEILSAAYMERQKMAFHSDNEIGLGPVVAGLSLGSPALMHFRINVKYDRLRELKGNLLSFVLRHGDILVMDGSSVQEFYEHTVIPNNFRIAATARYITPGLV